MWPWGGGAPEVDIGDNVPNSLMLDSTASQGLSRTPTVNQAGSTAETVSIWKKLGKLGTYRTIFEGYVGVGIYTRLILLTNDTLQYEQYVSGSAVIKKVSNRVFSDPNAFFNFVVKYDSTQAVQADRLKIYANNEELTSFSTNICNTALNATDSYFCYSTLYGNTIGYDPINGFYDDGYYSNFILVKGQGLTPDNFGRTSADTGAWVNKTYTGTYGANGFILEFKNGASLGTDTSGNGNNWTLNGGITSANQTTDTPTNNYCVWNALVPAASLTVGNKKMAASTLGRGTIAINGKMYWEITSAGGTTTAGMLDGSGTATATTTITTGVTKGFRFDSAAGTFDWTTDGISWTSIATGLTNSPYVPYASTAAGTTATINSGSKAWLIGGTTPPTGYGAHCTANLPQPSNIKPSNAVAHRWEAGSGIAANIAIDRATWSNWIEIFKRTDSAEDWKLRFSSDIGNMIACNTNAAKTAWVAPSAGTYLGVALQVSVANGIATGTYAGNNAASQDVAHGLGTAAKFALIKDESTGSVYIWHTSMTGATYFTIMNSATPPAQSLTNTPFGGGGWTSITFGVTNNATNNLNATGHTYRYILFADVPGFLKNATHTGNGAADGAFEYADGRPQLHISKNLNVATDFILFSDLIDPYNVTASTLSMNTTAAKAVATGVDIVSNGIKHRSATVANAANPYMDVSLLRNSIKYSNAR